MKGAPKIDAALREQRIARGRDVLARGNLDLLFSLGAKAYAAERERQKQDFPGVRFTPRPAQDLHRERERADSDGEDGA